MKSVSKILTFAVLSLFVFESALAASVYIPPSKTKPDISKLKADPGCKYVVEYNEFVREYSVNHVCDSWNVYSPAPARPQPAQPVTVQQQAVYVASAPVYPTYVNNVSNSYSLPAWGFAFPSFTGWFSDFGSWFYEPADYTLDVVEPVYEVGEYSWFDSFYDQDTYYVEPAPSSIVDNWNDGPVASSIVDNWVDNITPSSISDNWNDAASSIGDNW